jgi:hypothetical protein
MKKLFLAVMLACLALPVFAQTDDPYAKFQGVWWGKADGGDSCHFIFSNNSLTMIGKEFGSDLFYFGNYFIDNDTIIYIIKCGFTDDDGWVMPPEEISIQEITMTFQYVFSEDKLVLIANGYPISLQRPKEIIGRARDTWGNYRSGILPLEPFFIEVGKYSGKIYGLYGMLNSFGLLLEKPYNAITKEYNASYLVYLFFGDQEKLKDIPPLN